MPKISYSYVESNASRDEVCAVSTPDGATVSKGTGAKAPYVPVPYRHLLDLVSKGVTDLGLEIFEEKYQLVRQGSQLFGQLWVAGDDDEFTRTVGIRSSHDGSLSVGICGGVTVMVCSNLCFSGEITEMRRHTRHVLDELPGIVNGALGRMVHDFEAQRRFLTSLKEVEVEQGADLDHFMMEAARQNILSVPTKIFSVLDEWRRPSFREWREHSTDLYGLFNAFTEKMKRGVDVTRMPELTIRLERLVRDHFGVTEGIVIDADAEATSDES